MVGTYDTYVADLAFHFLTDTDTRHPEQEEHVKRVHSLACAIQQTIEDWIDSHPIEPEEKHP